MTKRVWVTDSTETDFDIPGTLGQGRSDLTGITPARLGGIKSTTGAPAVGTWQAGTVIYDSAGTQWLCTAGGTPGTWVNPAVAGGTVADLQNAIVATNQGTASSSFTDLATVGPVVTSVIPASGKCIVMLYAGFSNDTAASYALMGFAMSGANTVAAASSQALIAQAAGTYNPSLGTPIALTGLTPGSTTFTCKYSISGSGNVFFNNRRIAVLTVP